MKYEPPQSAVYIYMVLGLHFRGHGEAKVLLTPFPWGSAIGVCQYVCVVAVCLSLSFLTIILSQSSPQNTVY